MTSKKLTTKWHNCFIFVIIKLVLKMKMKWIDIPSNCIQEYIPLNICILVIVYEQKLISYSNMVYNWPTYNAFPYC